MIVKCPFCLKVFDDDVLDIFGSHLMNHSKIEMAVYIKDKLFKIHEKIEHHSKIRNSYHTSAIRILKSLLENDKK